MDEETEVKTEVKVEDEAQSVHTPSSFPPRTARPPKPKKNRFSWFAFPLVFMLGLACGWLLWGQSAGNPTQAGELQKATRYEVSLDDDPSIGPVNAPVTIVEFSDYQCPYCTQWYDTVASRLFVDYKDKIHFVYRDLPLSPIHPDAQSAAEAANCAGEQKKYWEYHDALFGEKYGFGQQAYIQYASELSLDMTSFNTCISERRYKQEVEADAYAARDLGINSTPAFFINGLYISGAQPYEVFKQIIDNELAAPSAK